MCIDIQLIKSLTKTDVPNQAKIKIGSFTKIWIKSSLFSYYIYQKQGGNK